MNQRPKFNRFMAVSAAMIPREGDHFRRSVSMQQLLINQNKSQDIQEQAIKSSQSNSSSPKNDQDDIIKMVNSSKSPNNEKQLNEIAEDHINEISASSSHQADLLPLKRCFKLNELIPSNSIPSLSDDKLIQYKQSDLDRMLPSTKKSRIKPQFEDELLQQSHHFNTFN